jgi:hypothetical protein
VAPPTKRTKELQVLYALRTAPVHTGTLESSLKAKARAVVHLFKFSAICGNFYRGNFGVLISAFLER